MDGLESMAGRSPLAPSFSPSGLTRGSIDERDWDLDPKKGTFFFFGEPGNDTVEKGT
jgi:hypothetical protein